MENANAEGWTAGTISDGQYTERSEDEAREPFGAGKIGTADGGGKLFADPGFAARGSDFGDGDTETPKRKRGRPAGSKNAAGKSSTTRLTGERLAGARRKLTDSLAGLVNFGFSWYGFVRANQYKKVSPFLAQRVYDCYQIPKEKCESVGEPLADTFIEWFPQYVETTAKAIDPGLAVVRVFGIMQQASEAEKNSVLQWKHYQETQGGFANQSQQNNGSQPEPETDTVEETINQWQTESHPQPEEIHPQYAGTPQ